MRVAIFDYNVPFMTGGAERLRSALRDALRRAGHETDVVTLPYRWYTTEPMLRHVLAWQLHDMSCAPSGEPIDRAIVLRFPGYLARHPRKTLWLLHQARSAYDLWSTEHSDLIHFEHGRRVRDWIREVDLRALGELERRFAISRNVANRLAAWNGLSAEVLHPPLPDRSRFRRGGTGDFVLSVGRLEPLKRHELLVRAMAHAKTRTRCVVVGAGPVEAEIRAQAARLGVEDRVEILGGIPDEALDRLYAGALAVFVGSRDEDYGYVTLEAFQAGKPVLTCADAGGPLEFVTNEETGLVVPPSPRRIAAAIDRLAGDHALSERLGRRGHDRLAALDLSWEHVIERLLA